MSDHRNRTFIALTTANSSLRLSAVFFLLLSQLLITAACLPFDVPLPSLALHAVCRITDMGVA